ncbi:PA26 p53-induced protein (sestrin) domain-containing protein [Rozella allomycis CSF55]|uniref:PA26 p53-induced protein (Sestrin) domain-containing protein n=1 Tax=Rozella allomycis (strain CSF55) TaxID=988480 RepID=A0A075AS33_ROZAC|nr:PA26 p53-induced protein (sestrin) domain-containing protein [Rozella allomycis CSF55]|eukprot:EPZ32990.1 PA26 p53-induced protein (sestrin) domain-containing protein [Rozella allomycis CSF55]
MQILAPFPQFLEKYLRCFHRTFEQQGPIPAASRFQCSYLFDLFKFDFLLHGGNPEWIKYPYRSEKLFSLDYVNSTLAYQPWRLKSEDLEILLKKKGWSKAELVQAITIICQVHSMCGIAFGCGVTPEIELPSGSIIGDRREPSIESKPVQSNSHLDFVENTSLLIDKLKNNNNNTNNIQLPENRVNFEKCDVIDMVEVGAAQNNENSDFKGFSNVEMKHQDFDVHSSEYSIFRLLDYSWDDHGMILLSKYLPDLGDLFSIEFYEIKNMTDKSVYEKKEGEEEIDTGPFRQAIWYYVLRISGMCHDDYDYQCVNRYLPRDIKSYIKKCVFYPNNVKREDFDNLGINLRSEEKVHVNLLAVEARKQACLLYSLFALMHS